MTPRQQMLLIFAIALVGFGYAAFLVWGPRDLPKALRNQKTHAVPPFERVKPEDRNH